MIPRHLKSYGKGFFGLAFALTLLAGLASCTAQEDDNAGQTTASAGQRPDGDDLDGLVEEFATLSLPIALPIMTDAAQPSPLESSLVGAWFSSVRFHPAIGGVQDVPSLTEGMEIAQFTAIGYLPLPGDIHLFVVGKQSSSLYYYLVTLDGMGQPIDGLCLAMREGDERNGVMRTASINDDLSIQIRQSEVTNGREAQPATAFFEVDDKGRIITLQGMAQLR